MAVSEIEPIICGSLTHSINDHTWVWSTTKILHPLRFCALKIHWGSPPVCYQFQWVIGCFPKTGDGVVLSFGAHARVHTMHIVASGYIRGPAKRVPTTEAVAVWWLSTKTSDTQSKGSPHSQPRLFSWRWAWRRAITTLLTQTNLVIIMWWIYYNQKNTWITLSDDAVTRRQRCCSEADGSTTVRTHTLVTGLEWARNVCSMSPV